MSQPICVTSKNKPRRTGNIALMAFILYRCIIYLVDYTTTGENETRKLYGTIAPCLIANRVQPRSKYYYFLNNNYFIIIENWVPTSNKNIIIVRL